MTTPSLKKLQPVSFTQVAINDAFWAPRQEVNRRVTLEMQYKQCKDTGRVDAFHWKPGQPNEPHIFWDSDLGKWVEAAAYSLMTRPDPELEKKIDAYVDDIAQAQTPEGYLNSHFQTVEPDKRWTNLRDLHELYCAGHLIEGAVAYAQATGKRKFLDIMCRYANYIDQIFGREEGKKRGYCGHPEIELALVKLFHATGETPYLKLSEYFVNERGQAPNFFDVEAITRGEKPGTPPWYGAHKYQQAHQPVREQTEVVGHSVRAMYLYCGMADVAAETGDVTLIAACKRLWKNVTARRMHVIGGIGPTAQNEGFTFDYDLPNENAYDETCANIALAFWAHRMLHMDPDGKYADVMERALYNGVISGVSLTGDHFFYANPLAAHPGVSPHGGIHGLDYHYRRSEWFGCACCPPNLARLLASLGGYVYSQKPGELWVNLYAGGKATLQLDGEALSVQQATQYPWNGDVVITLTPPAPLAFTLALRIPGWCRKHAIKVNGKTVKATVKNGYARVRQTWNPGDVLSLSLEMPVELIEAHPHVRQNGGRVALQRGPVVYCLEEVDNGPDLTDVTIIVKSLKSKWEPRLLGGVMTLVGKGERRDPKAWGDTLYQPHSTKRKAMAIKAIPYSTWCNRKPGEMLVWVMAQ